MRHLTKNSPNACDSQRTPGRAYWRKFGVCLGVVIAFVGAAEAVVDPVPMLVETWRQPEGLPQNSVVQIVQTPDGYLWLGTRGGLARFDGENFTTYGLADGLRVLYVTALLDDGDGGLWIGTYGGGLSHLQDGTISTATTVDGLAHDYVVQMAAAGGGAIWVNGLGGLQRYQDGEFTPIGQPQGLPDSEILAIETGASGELWIATHSGLFRYGDGKCEAIPGPDGEAVVSARDLIFDHEGALWAGIGNGKILKRGAGQWTVFDTADGVPTSFVYCMAEGSPGEIWAGTHEQGLVVLRDGRFSPVGGEGEIGQAVRSLYRTSDGLMWVGTQATGLHRLAPAQVEAHTFETRGRIHSIVEAPDGKFWTTTYGGGVLTGDLETMNPIDAGLFVAERPFFLCGLNTRSGTSYFGSSGLVLRVDHKGSLTALPCEGSVIALFEDDEGTLWTGSPEGELRKLVGDELQKVPGGKFPGFITSIEQGDGAALWIATVGAGLYRWEKGEVEPLGMAEGLPMPSVATLYRDGDGTLWIGTPGAGLAWVRDGELLSVNASHGLADNVVTQILEDDAGHLWLGGQRGISRVPKRALFDVAAGRASSLHPLLLDESDGMPSAECTGGYSPAGLRSSSGKLYFATASGVAEVDPLRFGAIPEPPPVLIESLLVDGQNADSREPSIVIPPSQHEIEIRYTAFDFLKPAQIRFRYRLEGLDGKWFDVGTRRSARFSHLPPGSYTFEVGAANASGNWGAYTARIAFTVAPNFWQTAWFRAVMVALLMLLGGAVAASLARRRIRRARDEVEAQRHQAEVAHLTSLATLGELSAALSHELNQPLAAILSNAQAAQRFLADGDPPEGEIDAILDDIVADDQRASEIIRRLRTLLKRGEFHPEKVDAGEVILQALSTMSSQLESRGVGATTELTAPSHTVRADRVQLQQVLINLVANACDAMAENPEGKRSIIIRSSSAEGSTLKLSVIDSGNGIAAGEEESIFEPYHTTKADGLGLGLSLSRSILFSHGGRLWAENTAGGGAEFHLTLPRWSE